MTTPSVGLGIVGCGWAASEIVRAMRDVRDLGLIAVCDADPRRAEALAATTGATVHSSIDELLANKRVTAVYAGLPHHLLAQTVEAALTSGKHVLSEKPLALESVEARRLGQLAEANGLKLAVFFELRRSGTIQAARKMLASGAVGDVRLVRIQTIIDKRLEYWGPPGQPNWRAKRAEAGGGVVMMNTIHQLDTLRYITGLEFVRASGEIATFAAPAEVEDAASATIRLSNGGLVSLVANAHSAGARDAETIEIDGTVGRLDLPNPFGAAPLHFYNAKDGMWNDVAVYRPDSHQLMLEDFVESILADGPVPASAADAAAAVGAVQAIYRSGAEGRAIDIS